MKKIFLFLSVLVAFHTFAQKTDSLQLRLPGYFFVQDYQFGRREALIYTNRMLFYNEVDFILSPYLVWDMGYNPILWSSYYWFGFRIGLLPKRKFTPGFYFTVGNFFHDSRPPYGRRFDDTSLRLNGCEDNLGTIWGNAISQGLAHLAVSAIGGSSIPPYLEYGIGFTLGDFRTRMSLTLKALRYLNKKPSAFILGDHYGIGLGFFHFINTKWRFTGEGIFYVTGSDENGLDVKTSNIYTGIMRKLSRRWYLDAGLIWAPEYSEYPAQTLFLPMGQSLGMYVGFRWEGYGKD